MRINEIKVGVKQSHNYNTYEVNAIFQLDSGEDMADTTRLVQKQCRELVEEEIAIEKAKPR